MTLTLPDGTTSASERVSDSGCICMFQYRLRRADLREQAGRQAGALSCTYTVLPGAPL